VLFERRKALRFSDLRLEALSNGYLRRMPLETGVFICLSSMATVERHSMHLARGRPKEVQSTLGVQFSGHRSSEKQTQRPFAL